MSGSKKNLNINVGEEEIKFSKSNFANNSEQLYEGKNFEKSKKTPQKNIDAKSSNKKSVPERQDRSDFARKYKDNIKKIFDEIAYGPEKSEKHIEATKLRELLHEADNNQTFSILIKKLDNIIKMNSSKVLRYDDFNELFCFDITDSKDFEILFDTIDGLGNQSGSIGLQELQKANELYELCLTKDDMENMIKYIGKEINFVSKEDLSAAICGEKEKFHGGEVPSLSKVENLKRNY